MAGIMEVTDKNFGKEVLEAPGKVLVDFWAPWCGPCRMQTPILEKLVSSGAVSAKITKLNTDENPETAQKYGIQAIPTLIIFQDGAQVDRLQGVQPEAVLTAKLK